MVRTSKMISANRTMVFATINRKRCTSWKADGPRYCYKLVFDETKFERVNSH